MSRMTYCHHLRTHPLKAFKTVRSLICADLLLFTYNLLPGNLITRLKGSKNHLGCPSDMFLDPYKCDHMTAVVDLGHTVLVQVSQHRVFIACLSARDEGIFLECKFQIWS